MKCVGNAELNMKRLIRILAWSCNNMRTHHMSCAANVVAVVLQVNSIRHGCFAADKIP